MSLKDVSHTVIPREAGINQSIKTKKKSNGINKFQKKLVIIEHYTSYLYTSY